MLRIIYQSEGTDDMRIVCSSIEEAINCFRADCEALTSDQVFSDAITIQLSTKEMTDEEVAAIPEE